MLVLNVCTKFLFKRTERNFKYNKKTKIFQILLTLVEDFSIYPDLKPEPLENYFNEIKLGLNHLKLAKMPEVICEPGRALCLKVDQLLFELI